MFSLLFFILVALDSPPLRYFVKDFNIDPSLDEAWNNYMKEHNKNYNGMMENFRRRLIFQTNFRSIEAHNRRYKEGKETFREEMNYFGDLTDNEFFDTYLGPGGFFKVVKNEHYANTWTKNPPKSVDWRKKGHVSRVKNQKECGSCWAFSVIASIESHLLRKNGSQLTFSEQQLVDCNLLNAGCNGGLPYGAYEYIMEKGISTDSAYPYVAKDQKCNVKLQSRPALKIKDYVSLPSGDEVAMKRAVATVGPVSAAMFVDWHMRFYKDGFFSDSTCPSRRMNHAVLVVGYGTDAPNQDYWLIKNTWGLKWGMGGFVKFARNRQNQCGIASSATYPLL